MTRIHEIAPDVYRISFFMPEINLEFALFLIKDEEPVLFHTLMKGTFPVMREAVAKVMDPAKLRWISFSHFEADECGALNEWLTVAPHAQPVTSQISALVNIGDFAIRSPHVLMPDQTLATGKHSFRFLPTPHLPHGWDAGVFFEESSRTLFCSDLFHQSGDLTPVTENDVLANVRQTLIEYQGNELLANYMPYTIQTRPMLERLAQLEPRTIATMHGSIFVGDGARALRQLDGIMKETLGVERFAAKA
ncbi:MAG: MBL fold metallo-hydrolase [Terriglobales bacterium]